MFISEPKAFVGALKPLIYFNCLVGTGAMRLPNQGSTTYTIMKLWTVIINLINWTAIYITWDAIPHIINYDNTSATARAMYRGIIRGNFCTTVIAPLLVWLRRKVLRDCVRQMQILDNTFQAVFGVRNEYRKQYIRLLCQVIATSLVIFIFVIIDNISNLEILLEMDIRLLLLLSSVSMTVHSPMLVMLVLDANFYTFLGYLGKKFRDVNDSLLELKEKASTSCPGKRLFVISQNVINTRPGNIVKNTRTEGWINEKHYLLCEIRKAHSELCQLSRKINFAFGMQNLLFAGISFVIITGLLYTTYSVLAWESLAVDKLKGMIPTLIWVSTYAARIWMINHSCWSVSNEAKRTGQVIYELLNSRVDKEFQNEIREFSLQILRNPVFFNACGFFTLDYTFVQGVIGSVTTYLVILIQMSNVPDRSTSDISLPWNGTKF